MNAVGTTLDELAKRAGLSVDDTIALAELQLRVDTAKSILKLFGIANVFVLVFVVVLMIADWFVLVLDSAAVPGDRLINSNVVMTLLGATTVQVGTIMVSISAYLFPKKGAS